MSGAKIIEQGLSFDVELYDVRYRVRTDDFFTVYSLYEVLLDEDGHEVGGAEVEESTIGEAAYNVITSMITEALIAEQDRVLATAI
jgi:hypothetical protein